MTDLWDTQDLPVLKAAVEDLDKGGYEVTAEHLATSHLPHLSVEQVTLSMKRLTLGGYLNAPQVKSMSWGLGDSATGYTGAAIRAIGTWPSKETALERLVAALEDAAREVDDDETKSALKKTARYLGNTATNLGVGIASAVIAGQ